MEEQDFRVDIDEALYSKNPKLYRILPRFVVSYIKKIAHQNDINRILDNYKNYDGVDFAGKVLEDLNVTYSIRNEENLPPNSGRYIFVSNHPLGGLDGVALIHAIGKKYDAIKFIVNDLLLYLKPLNSVFVPVNKHGRQSSEYSQRIEDVYASDNQILYFPAGLCSRRVKGKIEDPEWKKNFLVKAIKSQRDIVPIYFEARNSNFFYNLASVRRFFGLKVNLEMFYLVDELFKKKNAHFTIHVGKPISYAEFNIKEAMGGVKRIREEVYSLQTTQGKNK